MATASGELNELHGSVTDRLEKQIEEIGRRVNQVELQMVKHTEQIATSEKGVNNFRVFQAASIRHQAYMKAATAILGVVIGLVGWMLKTGIDGIKDNLQPILRVIIEEEIKEHPELKDSGKLPKIGSVTTADINHKENATLPSEFESSVR